MLVVIQGYLMRRCEVLLVAKHLNKSDRCLKKFGHFHDKEMACLFNILTVRIVLV